MNFIEAINVMRDGKGIRLPHWRAKSHIKKDEDVESGYVICLDQRVKYYQFKETEMLSDEWEIYREESELHTFEQALTSLKNGKKIRRQSSISEYHLDKASSRILEIYDVEVHNGEAWWGESFSYKEILANDWIILDK